MCKLLETEGKYLFVTYTYICIELNEIEFQVSDTGPLVVLIIWEIKMQSVIQETLNYAHN